MIDISTILLVVVFVPLYVAYAMHGIQGVIGIFYTDAAAPTPQPTASENQANATANQINATANQLIATANQIIATTNQTTKTIFQYTDATTQTSPIIQPELPPLPAYQAIAPARDTREPVDLDFIIKMVTLQLYNAKNKCQAMKEIDEITDEAELEAKMESVKKIENLQIVSDYLVQLI